MSEADRLCGLFELSPWTCAELTKGLSLQPRPLAGLSFCCPVSLVVLITYVKCPPTAYTTGPSLTACLRGRGRLSPGGCESSTDTHISSSEMTFTHSV